MDIDWQAMFLPTVALAEIFLRGTIIYLAIFLFMRFLPPREIGGMGLSDVLVVVLIADAAQNGMAADYHSVTEGLLLVLTIIFWSYCIDTLDHHFPRLKLAAHSPVRLIKNGQLLKGNMDRQKISEEELLSHIRLWGVDEFTDIKSAYIEGDGQISVIMQRHLPNNASGKTPL